MLRMDCTIRTLQREDIRLAIDWAADEGWNPGLHDAESFHAADPEGFLVAQVEGVPVGCISAVAYGAAAGLYAGLCDAVPVGEAVYLDVPQPNAEAVALANAHGMVAVFETARMYAGPAPACRLDTVYGVTTFELG